MYIHGRKLRRIDVNLFRNTPEKIAKKMAKKEKKIARREMVGNISTGVLIGMIQYSFFALFFSLFLFPMFFR